MLRQCDSSHHWVFLALFASHICGPLGALLKHEFKLSLVCTKIYDLGTSKLSIVLLFVRDQHAFRHEVAHYDHNLPQSNSAPSDLLGSIYIDRPSIY
ncbi:hypothetical protein B0H11DRAFT_2275135, partial [Mycena galericulata]